MNDPKTVQHLGNLSDMRAPSKSLVEQLQKIKQSQIAAISKLQEMTQAIKARREAQRRNSS